LVLIAACGGTEEPSTGGSDASATDETITLYTCATDTTVQPVIEAFEQDNPSSAVELYRAPTADLNARVAGDVRSGGLQADVIWACDPLTMQDYVAQDLVGGWTPETDVAEDLRTEDYVGVALLYVVAVAQENVAAPENWADLTGDEYGGAIALPDAGFSATGIGTLGYFAQNPDFGIEYYEDLKANGAVQVNTPDEVTTGVAEGLYTAGITTANSAYAAQGNGSPIQVVWPEPGAIAIYGPAALATDSADSATAKAFLTFLASEAGQTVIADAGSYPSLDGVPGPTIPEGSPIAFPDWAELADQKDSLLADFQQIFGS